MPYMSRNQPTVICAWCTRVLSEGSGDVTHGICPACSQDVFETAEKVWRDRDDRSERSTGRRPRRAAS